MLKLRIFILSALLITTSASFAYPQEDLFQLIKQLPFEECEESSCPYSINNLLSSYDLFLQLLDDIETDELENKCSARDIVRINHFLALLARIGHLPGDDELQLEKDIEELLSDEDDFDETDQLTQKLLLLLIRLFPQNHKAIKLLSLLL